MNIERARIELLLGDVGAGEALLRTTLERLESLSDAGTDFDAEPPALWLQPELLHAVALSLTGQSLERRGDGNAAATRFVEACERFRRVPEDRLTARDHGDYGVALAGLGRDDEARAHLKRARDGRGATPEASRHLARVLLDHGDASAAERLLTEVLQVVPADADAFALLARAQGLRGHPAAAKTNLAAAYLLVQSGRASDARPVLRAARTLVGDDPAVLRLNAEVLWMEGRHVEAIEEFDSLLEVVPDDPWLLGRRAAVQAALGRWTEARSDLHLATTLAPEDGFLLLLAGRIALESGDMVAAGTYCDRALAAEPGQPAAYALRARLARAQGALGKSREAAVAGRALAPLDADLLRLHAELEHEADNVAVAIELLGRLCSLPDAGPLDHAKHADLLASAGRLEEAEQRAAAATARWPDDVRLIELHGDLLRRLGRLDESIRVLSGAADTGAGSARLTLLLGLALRDAAERGERTHDEALSALARSAALEPSAPEPHYFRGRILGLLGRRSDARAELEATLERDPAHLEALALLVEDRLSSGDAAGAETLARRLIGLSPGSAQNAVLLAQALIEQGRPTEALGLLAGATADAEADPEARTRRLLLRGRALIAVDRLADAQQDLSLVVELQPDLADGWMYLAELARLRGDACQALEHADRALTRQPYNVQALGIRAAALVDLDRAAEAKVSLDEALRLDPNYVLGLVLRAQLTAPDDLEGSRQLLERATRANPDDQLPRLLKAWLDIDSGAYEAALAEFDRLLEDRELASALSGRAEALRLLGRSKEAITAAERALALRPDDPEALRSLGFTLLVTQDYERSLQVFSRACDLYPGDMRAATDLGYAFAVVEKMDEALELLDLACVTAPDYSWGLTRLAQVLLDIGHFEGAERVYRRLHEVAPGDVTSWNGLGWALQHLAQPRLEEAERAYRRALEFAPGDLWVRKGIAGTQHVRGEKEAAAELYREVAQEAERRRAENPEVLEVLGWCAFRLGDFVGASRALYEAASTQDKPSGVRFDLALASFFDGRTARAIGLYQSAVELVGERHQHLQRGYISVALADFRQALRDYPHRGTGQETKVVTDLLETALGDLPPVPDLETLRRMAPG